MILVKRTSQSIFNALVSLAISVCGVACSGKIEPEDTYSALDVKVSIASEGEDVTDGPLAKSIIDGSSIPNKFSYGLFACKHEDSPSQYEPFSDKTNNINIKGYRDASTWKWAYAGNSESYFSSLIFFSNNPETEHLDFYAYAPWKSGVTLKKGYTFDLVSQNETDVQDIMYATYPVSGDQCNLDKEITKGQNLPLKITFNHVFSRLRFYFRLAHSQNTGYDGTHYLMLNKIVLSTRNYSTTPLYVRGVMNILNHELVPDESTEASITYTGETNTSNYKPTNTNAISSSTSWKNYSMLIYPIDYPGSNDYFVTFYFNNSSNNTQLKQTYTIRQEDLIHTDDPSIIGFQEGYIYNFYFVIDNYIRLQNIEISNDWGIDEAQETEILL